MTTPKEQFKMLVYMGEPSLVQYASVIHGTAVEKGWWGLAGQRIERSVAEVSANIHSEVTEMWKEWVHNHDVTETYYTMDSSKIPSGVVGSSEHTTGEMAMKWVRFQEYLHSDGSEYAQKPEEPTKFEVATLVGAGILEPHGIPTELADIVIRCLDLFEAWGLDADEVVQEKMTYNLTRPHRHGGKRA